MQRAFVAGAMTAIICPAIGVFLVPRRLSLIADSLAHVALAGVALGLLAGVSPHRRRPRGDGGGRGGHRAPAHAGRPVRRRLPGRLPLRRLRPRGGPHQPGAGLQRRSLRRSLRQHPHREPRRHLAHRHPRRGGRRHHRHLLPAALRRDHERGPRPHQRRSRRRPQPHPHAPDRAHHRGGHAHGGRAPGERHDRDSRPSPASRSPGASARPWASPSRWRWSRWRRGWWPPTTSASPPAEPSC